MKFPLCDDYTQLPSLPKWSRVSVVGFIVHAGFSALHPHEPRKGFVRETTIGNGRMQGMNVRIVHLREDDMDFLATGLPIAVDYGKTMVGGLYADLNDLCRIEESSADVVGLCPNLELVKRIAWM